MESSIAKANFECFCIICFLSILLAASVGHMTRTLCSDWLSARAKCTHLTRSGSPALILYKEKIAWSGLTNFAIFEKCPRLRCKERKNTVKTKKTQASVVSLFAANTVGFLTDLALEINKALLILKNAKKFCYIINPLLTKLVRSRLLDSSLLLLFLFL